MSTPEFVYSSYVRASPEQVWEALTSPELTTRYWGVALESDWDEGSALTWTEGGVTADDPDQVVVEADRPRRLSYRWHAFTPEWGDAVGIDEQVRAAAAAEPRSTVTFDVVQLDETVKLTVVHGGFEPGSVVLDTVRQGWPAIVSNLKTLLETGDTLPFLDTV